MKNNQNVCFVLGSFPPLFTGAGQQALSLAKELKKQGVNVFVITTKAGACQKEEDIEGIKVYRLAVNSSPCNKGLDFAPKIFVALFQKRRQYDIVHIHGACTPFTYAAILAARLFGKKIVVKLTLFGDDDPYSLSQRRCGKIFLRVLSWVNRIIGLSEVFRHSYLKTGLPSKAYSQIPNGVDTQKFSPLESLEQKQKSKKQLGFDLNCKILVFVGAICKRKGVDFLVDVFSRVAQNDQSVSLVLVGPVEDEDYLTEIKQKVHQWGGDKRLVFIGKTDNVEDFLKIADVFVFASLREGFPNALVEAMACGLPVVVSNIQGITEAIVASGQEGFLIPPGDSAAFTVALTKLLSNEKLASQMGGQARRKIEKKFSISSVAERYLLVYNDLLGVKLYE
ncbi:hypothetical protein A2291_03080 [candidate division WOR-1 bacterium RIFOXYB2_FULL_42_35]|uniref:Glycosyltransferase subfamily 4-like N-terminal domain-containing protein n=1 Tax=candidate division WOR-1 bacterium RIFOXYC2_FULL_41_25 TaxID=1802586 RepID=A0A1F4TR12_UNCSA|nr:MAG: hypothetical protein A2247_01390 [candidate division WOR-1 bacterium RIFOXYA2_FULL_41_14]OGC25729.1 MAG: hypothetical protein A2291_03080 [candidate division WOR-1 bacterium RIFOXYB2_FULL_42_35]OGC35131.1 MAG: hypothetical protein A2462_06225 [candidate division WOR-1 bacterium RIFOXYC2_FULL_41_25]OGC42194.1 MAG: hypothetical protein A2548_03540 [candidate division WOR-1 bacterium RIFOXYD2_FULL_41_8]